MQKPANSLKQHESCVRPLFVGRGFPCHSVTADLLWLRKTLVEGLTGQDSIYTAVRFQRQKAPAQEKYDVGGEKEENNEVIWWKYVVTNQDFIYKKFKLLM